MTSQNLTETGKAPSKNQNIAIPRKPRPKYRLFFSLAVLMTSFVPLGLYFSSSSAHSVTPEAVASLYRDREYSALQDQPIAAAMGNVSRVGIIEAQPEARTNLPPSQEIERIATAKPAVKTEQKIASSSGVNLKHSDADSRFIMPTMGRFTSAYGMRWGRLHAGIDIAGPVGTPVVAVKNGIVIAAGMNAVGHGYGNGIDIRHQDGSISRYAHAEKILVRVGQSVKQGQKIMLMGCSGHCTGPHLHFEIHVADEPVDPRPYLP
jgi:murein DD-endopeptidase MepM/ murein hydrolase activator NlpD